MVRHKKATTFVVAFALPSGSHHYIVNQAVMPDFIIIAKNYEVVKNRRFTIDSLITILL